MSDTLLLVWAGIAVVGIIAIIIVKIYYSEKDEKEDYSDITSNNSLHDMISEYENPKDTVSNNNYYYESEKEPIVLEEDYNKYEPVAYEAQNNIPNKNISYSSQNQVLINYDNEVQKFQEPITQTQRDMMNQNNEEKNNATFKKTTESKHELKDLFTIDELIKESKRKDDEREKESKTINKEEVDNSDIKESIKKNRELQENKTTTDDTDLTDIKSSIEKIHEIADSMKSGETTDLSSKSTASQKDIIEAIDSASNEEKEEVPEISETPSITDAVIKKEEEKEETTIQDTLTPAKEEEIKAPTLKTPTKVEEDSVSILPGADEDYEFGASIDSSNLFEDENGELSDLDYRKDLAKVKNSLKNSSLIQEIRGKLTPEQEENTGVDEEFIRNVNSYTEEEYPYYDEYEPIINETHVDYLEPTPEELLRQENTRKVFNTAKESSTSIEKEELIPTPKAIPEKSSLKITINNNEEVLRKGDEIIYKHDGETYSSKVYSINGDDIKVKYRRQDITIKPSDIKKIY